MILGLVASAFVAGIALGHFVVADSPVAPSVAAVAAAAVLASFATLFVPPPRPRRLYWILPALLVAGTIRGVASLTPTEPLPHDLRTQTEASVEGVLAREPRPYGDAQLLTIEVDRYLAGDTWRPSRFRVDVIATHLAGAGALGRVSNGFLAGDRYLITGQLSAASLSPAASQGSAAVVRGGEVKLVDADHSRARRMLGTIRSALGRSIDRSSPEPAAGLIKAMVTGERTGLSAQTREAFRRSGTSHVLSISGMHVGIVAVAALSAAAALLGRRRQLYLLVPAFAVWAYAALAGFSPPVARSAIMASVLIGGRALGRQRSVAPALGLAAAIMAALQPSILGDISFQLSFLAMLGMVLIGPGVTSAGEALLDRYAGRLPDVVYGSLEKVNAAVAMSAGAISLTAPVVALRFDSISIWGTPATLLQVPALPLLIVSGAAEAAAGLVWEPIAVAGGLPAWAMAEYVIAVAELFGRLPGGSVRPEGAAVLVAAAYYVGLFALLNRARLGEVTAGMTRYVASTAARAATWASRPSPPRRAAPILLLIAMIGAAALAWGGVAALPEGRLDVTFFETEGGDSILIRTPTGRQALIDGGDSTLGAVRALSSNLPFWDRSLDLVVLTHPHADHARGLLAVLERYRVDAILDSPSEYDSAVYDDWRSRADREGARRIAAVPGTVIALDDDVRLNVLFAQEESIAPDPNDRSVVLKLTYGEATFLFTGDLSSVAERRLLDAGIDVDADVLKVGHQGSRGSSSEQFLAAVSPSIAVVPASIGNRFGHPHAEALDRLSRFVDAGQILITMDRGTVRVESDGRGYRIDTDR